MRPRCSTSPVTIVFGKKCDDLGEANFTNKILTIFILGIPITGGFSNDERLSSVELFLPGLNLSCSLPDMTRTREDHTHSVLSCGGKGYLQGTSTSCEAFTAGAGWRLERYNLTTERWAHTSWALGNGSIVLLGGWSAHSTTEILTPGVGTRPAFNLKYPSR